MDLAGKRILVPMDGSPLAERALPTAERVAAALGSELVLARVTALFLVPFDPSGGAASAEAYQQLADDEVRIATAYLERIAGDVRGRGRPVKTVIQRGEPASTLLDLESQQDVGLVVMTTHGRTGLARFALGSTADRLVRHGHTPVLLLRPAVADREDETFAQVMVPLDGSPLGDSALTVAASLAGRLLHHIVLLRVIPDEASTEAEVDAGRQLGLARAHLSEQLAGRPCAIELLVVRGSADQQIIQQAQARQSPIIMATHGTTGIRRWSYGSIADQVLHQADVPVLLVHPPLPQLPTALAQVESGQP